MKLNIKIDINQVRVKESSFSFKYKLWENEEDIPSYFGEYEASHGWSSDPEGFKKLLKSGYAFTLVLELIYKNIKHS